jgi:hypothetical protein
VKVTIATTLVIVSFISQILPRATAQPAPQIDAGALVRQSVQNYERDWREAMSWSYRQTDVTKSDDNAEVEVSEVVPIGGTPYERLLMKNGQKLPAEEQKKEEHKYEKTLRARETETPAERQERIRKYEAERAFVKDIPDAYDFKLCGETMVNGRAAWIIKMSPKAGFIPTAPHSSMLRHIEGTLWLDKEDLQWAKAEADVIDTIEIGWILARVGPGTHFYVQQTRVADGLWLPERIVISGVARVLLVHERVLNEELTFSGYQKGSALANANPPANEPGKSATPQPANSFR